MYDFVFPFFLSFKRPVLYVLLLRCLSPHEICLSTVLNRWACTHKHTSNSWPNNMYLVHTISLYRPTRLNENTRRRHGKKKRKETHKRGMKCEQHRIERRAILESSSRTFRRFVFLRKCTFSLSAQPATYVAIWVQCVPITLPTLISEDRDMRTDMVNIDDAPKGLVIPSSYETFLLPRARTYALY